MDTLPQGGSDENLIIAVVYSGPAKTCYDHGGALHDDKIDHDAKYYYCDTSNPDKYACTNQYLSATWRHTKKGLHGLEQLYTRITSSAARTRPRLWMAATLASTWALLARQRI